MIARGEAHCKSGGIDYPDTGFEETQWLPQDKEKWTDWVELDEHYGLRVCTYVQRNAIMIQTLRMNDCATVVVNYHQFTEIYKHIEKVGQQTEEYYSAWRGNLNKLSGRSSVFVMRDKSGLLVDRVFISAELCEALTTPGGDKCYKLLKFFDEHLVKYPAQCIPGFLL